MKKAIALGLALVLTSAPALAAAQKAPAQRAAARSQKHNPLAIAIDGAVNDPRFAFAKGTATIVSFERAGTGINAVGVFHGTVTDMAGHVTTVTQSFSAPVVLPDPAPTGGITIQQTGPNEPGVCDILFLEIGPIELDLLGLVLNTDVIRIDLDAVAGAGNLLGNLLCAIVGLLDPVAILASIDRIVTLLNSVADILQNL